MSYGLSAFAVPMDRLARAVGQGDLALRDEALSVLAEDLDSYDEQMNGPGDASQVSHADALREIFAGEFSGADNNSAYGWAFECLCDFLGDRLDNPGFVPCRMEWYGQLDAILGRHGVPLRFADLIGTPPVAIPVSDDWPCVGHWPAATMAVAATPLATAVQSVTEAEAKAALQTALAWVRFAIARPGTIVIGFHG